MCAELCLGSRFTARNRIQVITDSDDLHDPGKQAVERGDYSGWELHGCRFAIHVWGFCGTDVPIRAAVNPNIETACQKGVDDVGYNVVGQQPLVNYRKVWVHYHAPVECGHRHLQPKGLNQHAHAARRSSAGDKKSDAALVEPSYGLNRTLGEDLRLRNERTVNVG